jgi:phenylacetyl-CoA:acceptor oxidoreductase subunit 2
LMVSTGLAEGSGLLLAAVAAWPPWSGLAGAAAVAAVALAALRAWAWHTYIAELRAAGAPRRALAVLAALAPWLLVLGLVLPATLIGIGLLLPGTAMAPFALAGLSICAAGGATKFILVTRAGYNQGFALVHTPVRGRGAPGPAIKPGWSAP